MSQNKNVSGRDELIQQFELLRKQKKDAAKIHDTRMQQIQREENAELLKRANGYTVEKIVKGLADQQLSFNKAIDSLLDNLKNEVNKLSELQQSIQIESTQLQDLSRMRIAGEAVRFLLHEKEILQEEMEQQMTAEKQALNEELGRIKAEWTKEEQDFITTQKDRQESLKKQRANEEADFNYNLEQKRRKEADAFEDKTRLIERDLEQTLKEREADWAKREALLTENEDLLTQQREKVEQFEKQLGKDIQEEIADVNKSVKTEAEFQTQLAEKEHQADKEIANLKIKSLENRTMHQEEEIKQMQKKLQEALQQVQSLAALSIGKTAKINGGKTKANQ